MLLFCTTESVERSRARGTTPKLFPSNSISRMVHLEQNWNRNATGPKPCAPCPVGANDRMPAPAAVPRTVMLLLLASFTPADPIPNLHGIRRLPPEEGRALIAACNAGASSLAPLQAAPKLRTSKSGDCAIKCGG